MMRWLVGGCAATLVVVALVVGDMEGVVLAGATVCTVVVAVAAMARWAVARIEASLAEAVRLGRRLEVVRGAGEGDVGGAVLPFRRTLSLRKPY